MVKTATSVDSVDLSTAAMVAQHKSRNYDKMSDHWSSGSICHPSSQSRKMSIGVMPDSLGNKRPGAAKADEVVIPNEGRVKSVMENAIKVRNKVEEITADTRGRQTEAPAQTSSPWITPRSAYKKESAPETSLQAKQGFGIPSYSGRQNKQQGGEDVLATHSVHLFASRTSVLQSVQSKQKMYDGDAQKSTEGRGGIADRVEELTFATAKEVFFSGKAVTENIIDRTENRCSGTLKMKLWEILGNASSSKGKDPQSHPLKVDMNHSTPAQNIGRMGETAAKYGQNSDTIETDSENPSRSIRRPVTRSLGQKRAPTKAPRNKVKDKAPSMRKQKQQEKNSFSIVEGWSSRLHNNNNGDSSSSTRKRNERQNSSSGLQKILYPEKDNAGKLQQKTTASGMAAHDEKSSSLGIIGRFHSCPRESDQYQPKNDIQEKKSHHSPTVNKTDKGDLNSPKLSGNKDKPECAANTTPKNDVDPEVDFRSPAFGIKTPIPNSSPSPVAKSNQMEQDVCNPAVEDRELSAGNFPSFRTLWTSKLNCHESSVQKKLSEDVQEKRTSPCKKSASVPEDKSADDLMAESSSEEGNSESSDEGCKERMAFSPDAGTAVRPKITLNSIKRPLNYVDIRFQEFSSTPASPKGVAGSDWMQEPPEQTQEDELARAVTLFARALKGLKRKIKFAAGKKSSEVLMSVAEGISLQLENINSQIQTDIEKLASVSKSKRRRLETKFQEQQEQLNLIREKFKEEVNRHLQECRETLDGLEAHQIEFKGTTEKQRASHKKLLLQVDEAIEMQLNDAQRRIMAINKLASGQMVQLKHVIWECLKGDI